MEWKMKRILQYLSLDQNKQKIFSNSRKKNGYDASCNHVLQKLERIYYCQMDNFRICRFWTFKMSNSFIWNVSWKIRLNQNIKLLKLFFLFLQNKNKNKYMVFIISNVKLIVLRHVFSFDTLCYKLSNLCFQN